MTSLPITPPSARVAHAQKGSSPPTQAGPGDFAALLTQTSARTAPAEGPKNRPARPEPSQRRDDHVDRGRDDEAHAANAARKAARDDDAQPADAPAPAPADGGDDQAAGTTDQGTPAGQDAAQPQAGASGPTAEQAAAQAAAAATPARDAAGQPGAAAVPAAAGTPTGAAPGAGTAVPAHAQPAALATGPDAQAADAAGQPGADAAADPAAGKLQIPAELLGARGATPHLKDLKKGDGPHGDLPPLPTLPPSASSAAVAATATAGGPGAEAGANTPNNGNPGQQAPATAPVPTPAGVVPHAVAPGAGGAATATATALTRGSVVQTAERVQELVRIATARSGNARATMQLRPESLGQIDVQLRTTRDGLVATIAAHDQAGLDALQQAGSELRRALEDRGVQLHSLDLQLGDAGSSFAGHRDAQESSSGRSGTASGSYDLDEDDDVVDEAQLTLTTAPSTAAGALVDVQA